MSSALKISIIICLISSSICLVNIPLHKTSQFTHNQRRLDDLFSDVPTIDLLTGIYTGDVQIGTPYQTFQVLFDTGFSDLLVYSVNCTDCNTTYLYNNTASNSSQDQLNQVSIQYQTDQTIQTDRYEDTVSIVGYDIAEAEFLVSNTTLSPNYPNGIFGLGLQSVSEGDLTSLFQLIAKQENFPQQFSIYLSPSVSGSSILFGGYDSQIAPKGFAYYNISSNDSWQVDVSSFGLGSQAYSNNGADLKGIFVSGIPIIVGAPGLFTSLLTNLPASVACSNIGSYPNLYFTFGSDVYEVSPNAYYLNIGTENCTLLIEDGANSIYEVPDGQVWLGVPFFESYYVTFDIDNHKIGMALPVEPSPPTPLAGSKMGMSYALFGFLMSIGYLII